jgi:vancomycin permeability regulator SanA
VPLVLVGLLALSAIGAWRLGGWLQAREGDRWLHAMPRKRVPWRLLAAAWIAGAAWFGAHALALAVFGLADDVRASDAAVVLGNEVLPDGTPHARLKSRLERAAGLYRAGQVRLVVVSGGKGRTGFEEADVMRDYLLSSGVPADRILVDRQGYTTFDSAVQARALLGPRGLRSVVLCSQYYHLPRARLAFERAGLGPVTTAHAPLPAEWHEPWSLLREWVGYYVYLVRPYPA